MLENKPSSFIAKLNAILKSKKFHEIIVLDESRGTINIFDKEKLQEEVLLDYFRHNKLSSFIRQLNLYGFKKIKHPSYMCFSHPALAKGKRLETILSQKRHQLEAEALQQSPSPPSRKIQNPHRNFSTRSLVPSNTPEHQGAQLGVGLQGLGYPMIPVGQPFYGSWGFPTPVIPYFLAPRVVQSLGPFHVSQPSPQ